MRWILALHIIFMVCWFAGLFYLPRLFVYHSEATDTISIERFKIMERRLFNGIMTPASVLTIIFGTWILALNFTVYMQMEWLRVKLSLVMLLIAYHIYCGYLVRVFKANANRFSHKFYRWFNEVPTLLLFAIVILVVVQPF